MKKTTSDRVLSVLDLFAGDRSEWTVEEAAAALRFPISTTYRYIRSLAQSELLVAYVPGRYVLGPAIIELDRQLRRHDPLINAAQPEMARLALELGADNVVFLARMYHGKVMCVHQDVCGNVRGKINYQRGQPMPLDRGAASKVILANISPRVLNDLAKRAGTGENESPWTRDDLKKELRQIRTKGFAITRGEVDAGMLGYSVPLFGVAHELEGSLSVVVREERREDREIVQALIAARKEVEIRLALRASGVESSCG